MLVAIGVVIGVVVNAVACVVVRSIDKPMSGVKHRFWLPLFIAVSLVMLSTGCSDLPTPKEREAILETEGKVAPFRTRPFARGSASTRG